MGYNLNNIDLDKYTVYFHITSSRLLAVEKEEARKYVFKTDDKLTGIFLTANKITGWFELTSNNYETVLVSDLKNMIFKMAESPKIYNQ